jgi:hypothetical protein
LAYSKLLVLTEVLQLPRLHREISEISEQMFAKPIESEEFEGEPYLKWASPARRFRETLQSIFLTEDAQSVTKDLETIVRSALYVITDANIYGAGPPPTVRAPTKDRRRREITYPQETVTFGGFR